jgi:hypothetical protein
VNRYCPQVLSGDKVNSYWEPLAYIILFSSAEQEL